MSSMGWAERARQRAIIDEAEKTAMQHLSEPFQSVLAKYALVGFDMEACARELMQLAAQAREARARASDAQTDYKIESRQARAVVDETEKWVDILVVIAEHAKLNGHPLGDSLDDLFADFESESWSRGMDSMIKALIRLEDTGHSLTQYGLPPDYIERSRALAERLHTERFEATTAEAWRMTYTNQLHKLLDEIHVRLQRISVARDAVKVVTGEDLPGFSLALLRSATAPRPAPAPDPNDDDEPTGL